MTSPPIERLVLRPAEAATLLGVSTRTLREYKQRGWIAWVPVGRGGVGYLRSDIVACLEEIRRRTPRPADPAPIHRARPVAPIRGGLNPVTGVAWGAHLTTTAAAAAGPRTPRALRGGSRQR